MHCPSLSQAYTALDYVPVVSTVTNLVNLVTKVALEVFVEMDQQELTSPGFRAMIYKKSWGRCFLLLIPVLGNIVIARSDYRKSQCRKIEQQLLSGEPVSSKKALDYLKYRLPRFSEHLTNTESDAYNRAFHRLDDQGQEAFFSFAIKKSLMADALSALNKENVTELHLSLDDVLPAMRDGDRYALSYLQNVGNQLRVFSSHLRDFSQLQNLDLNISVYREIGCRDVWGLQELANSFSCASSGGSVGTEIRNLILQSFLQRRDETLQSLYIRTSGWGGRF